MSDRADLQPTVGAADIQLVGEFGHPQTSQIVSPFGAVANVHQLSYHVEPFIPVTGNVALADVKLCTVTGATFVDLGAAINVAQYAGRTLTLTDGTGKTMVLSLVAAGTQEVLTDNLWSNPGFDLAANVWANTTGVVWSMNGTASKAAGQASTFQQGVGSTTGGCLAQYTVDVIAISGSLLVVTVGGVTGRVTLATTVGVGQSVYVRASQYAGPASKWGFYMASADTCTIDNALIKFVTAPGPTGATATLASVTGLFDRNDVTGYSWEVS